MWYLLFTILLIGCGRNTDIPMEVAPYVQVFEEQSGRVVNGIAYSFDTLGYTDVKGGIIGECDPGSQSIVLDSTFWNEASNDVWEVVVLHELGHCILGRAHLNTFQPGDGWDVSIMNAYLLGIYEFDSERAYYLDELMQTVDVPMLNGNSAGVYKCLGRKNAKLHN